MTVASGAGAGRLDRLGWSCLNAVQLVFTLLWSALWITVALVVGLVARRGQADRFLGSRIWGPGLLRAAGVELAVEGREKVPAEGPLVFVANHSSIMDIPVLFTALPRRLHFLLKAELRRMPFVGWYAASRGMIFVDRRDRHRSLESMRRAGELVVRGRSAVAFPEGTRSRDGSVMAFKTGPFLTAIAAGVPVVPVGIVGARPVLPPGGFAVRPGVIRVCFGEPIPTAELGREDRRRLAEQARDQILDLTSG